MVITPTNLRKRMCESQGGSGMEGLLASIRDILWAPITQAAFRLLLHHPIAASGCAAPSKSSSGLQGPAL
eukprot:1150333-Pelagomonas_calceolata.AAC.7